MLILCLSFAVALLDQVTKHAIHTRFVVGDQATVMPGFFSLSHVRNTGAAWGILSGMSSWLVAFSVVMLVVVVFFRRSFVGDGFVGRMAAGLMIGGIVGNLIDRLRLGYVVDFLHFYWRSHAFPDFNVADSAICTGVGLYLLSQFLSARKTEDGLKE